MFCDKTGTLTENKMIFKRCTIGGSDFAHKSFSRVSNLGIQSQDSSCVKDNQSGRAIIPVNPILSERLNSIDRQILINGTDTKITKDKQVLKIAYLGSLSGVRAPLFQYSHDNYFFLFILYFIGRASTRLLFATLSLQYSYCS